jgi:predicted phage terminase large subunit-like protein
MTHSTSRSASSRSPSGSPFPTTSSNPDGDLLLLRKLLFLRDLQRREAEQERATFLTRYPTPGIFALAIAPHNTKQTPALEAIDAELAAVAAGTTDRLMIFCPPQEGKSTRTACWYPLWRLAADPSLRIAIVSYNQQKALRWGKWLRRMIEKHPELGITLEAGSRAADRFETTAGGKVLAVGIAGGITGEAVDELIIDDPIEGRAEAESRTYRDRAWDWWESNAMTRASSRFRVVLMMTRWHSDDLAGRLLKEEPGEWKVLRIPAIREDGVPLVRGNDGASVYNPNGELISVQDRPPGWFFKLRDLRSAYVWRSVYAQNPVAAEGNLFRKNDFRYWYAARSDRQRTAEELGGMRIRLGQEGEEFRYVSDMRRFLTIDLAASTKTSADWSVAAVWGLTDDGLLLLLDQDRQRLEEADHFKMVRPLAERWAAPDVYVEKGFIGSTLVIDATRAGLRVRPLTPDKDKITRAIPATNRVRAGRVWFPAGAEWLGDWIAELAEFPTGEHDDRVDTLAYAARVMAAHWLEPEDKPTPREQGRRLDPAQEAYVSNVGTGTVPDLNTADW